MEKNYCLPSGLATERYAAYLGARASAGVALLYTESSFVRQDGKARRFQLGVHEDAMIPGLRVLAHAVHAQGALLGVELNHAGRNASPAVSGVPCIAPSAVTDTGHAAPREVTLEEIRGVAAAFAAAARRCVDAGVDVLTVHGAHGYLVHQFMMRHTNLRTDEYGQPQRFANEVLEAIRSAVPDATLGIRISALDGSVDGTGLDLDKTYDIIRRLRLDLLDFIDVSQGGNGGGSEPSGDYPEGGLASAARRYRQFGKPVSVAGRIASAATAARIVRDGDADLVSIGRALHADAEFARSVLDGSDSRPCITCSVCHDGLVQDEPITCAVNPEAGHEFERERSRIFRSPRTGEEVLVIGAGLKGMELAVTLASAGRRVRLVEREAGIGGDFALAASLRAFPQYRRLLDWYDRQLRALGVTVELHQAVDSTWLGGQAAAVVLDADADRPYMPDVLGITDPRVIGMRAWLRGSARSSVTKPHVVWGGGGAGIAIADDIAARGGSVVLVSNARRFGTDLPTNMRREIYRRLMANEAVVLRPTTELATIEPTRLGLVIDGQHEWLNAAGPVIVAEEGSRRPAYAIRAAIAEGRSLGRQLLDRSQQ